MQVISVFVIKCEIIIAVFKRIYYKISIFITCSYILFGLSIATILPHKKLPDLKLMPFLLANASAKLPVFAQIVTLDEFANASSEISAMLSGIYIAWSAGQFINAPLEMVVPPCKITASNFDQL